MTVHAMAVMDHVAGDTKTEWDSDNDAEVAAARAVFDSLVGDKKYLAYTLTDDGQPGSIIREFDPEAEAMILTPQLVGG